ncbi:hypothetical protein FRC01_001753 [Tulasnella sp. 417]|nr:hypothetical protein FRC01_001753 [Tulasnella sp. 417]
MMDLPFQLDASKHGLPTIADAKKGARDVEGDILCLSACEDWQNAYDFGQQSRRQGILTSIIQPTLGMFELKLKKKPGLIIF